MRVLVTGASGFIGKNVVKRIIEKTDWEVVAMTTPSGDGEVTATDRVEVRRTRIAANGGGQLAEIVGDVDRIYHFASASHVPMSIERPVDVVRNNVDLQLAVLEMARQVEPELFVQLSTEGVYGTTYDPVEEWSLPALPSNPYAASKAAQEDLCVAWWRTYGVPIAIVNVVNVFGPGQSREKFIPMIIKKLKAGEEIEVHGSKSEGRWEFGARSYEYVKNLADILELIGQQQRPADDARPERWHLGGLQRVGNRGLIEMVAKLLDVEANMKFVEAGETRPGYDACYTLGSSKLEAIGWEPSYSFAQGLEETVLGGGQ